MDEAELDRGLLDPLAEVVLVEGEAELAVLEHVVGARLVVPSAGRFLIHELKPICPRKPSGSRSMIMPIIVVRVLAAAGG